MIKRERKGGWDAYFSTSIENDTMTKHRRQQHRFGRNASCCYCTDRWLIACVVVVAVNHAKPETLEDSHKIVWFVGASDCRLLCSCLRWGGGCRPDTLAPPRVSAESVPKSLNIWLILRTRAQGRSGTTDRQTICLSAHQLLPAHPAIS